MHRVDMLRFIMAHPRSAQNYISRVIHKTGLCMGVGYKSSNGQSFYKDDPPLTDGVVSFYHKANLPNDIVLHQVRDPLKVISSTRTETATVFNMMFSIIGSKPHGERFYVKKEGLFTPLLSMWTWLYLNKRIEQLASWRYRIEDIDKIYPELCDRLMVKPLKSVPDIPRNFNTRPHNNYTWEELKGIDEELCKKTREKGIEYGYD